MTVEEQQQTKELVVREPTVLDDFARLGTWLALAESGDDSERARGAGAALRLYYARELGLVGLAAQELSIVRGKIVVGAKLLRARALDAGYKVERVESSATACTARLVSAATGEIVGETTYTIEQAQRAGLVKDRSAWKTYPERMLWHRATKFVLDDYAPHVSLGLIEEGEVAEFIEGTFKESEAPGPVSSARAGGREGAESEPPQSAGGAATGNDPAPSAPSASEYEQHRQDTLLTFPQFQRLNVQVGTMREAGQVTTEQLYAILAQHRGTDVLSLVNELKARDEEGVLHWSPLRDSLKRSEASRLSDWLDRRAAVHPAKPPEYNELPEGY